MASVTDLLLTSNRPCLLGVAILACTVASSTVNAQPFTFDAVYRARYESKQDFNFSGGEQTYTLSRLRLDFGYRLSDQSNIFVRLQDARVFGESRTGVPPVNDSAVPNIFADQLDFNQAYYEHDFGAVTLRAGRQALDLGDRRFVGSQEWVNTGRVNDGIRFTIDGGESRQIDVFFSRLVAVDPNSLNDQVTVGNRYLDSEYHGIVVGERHGTDRQFEYWYLYRGNSDLDDQVHTIGARVVRQAAPWRFELQGAWQFGDFDGLDHNATMLHTSVTRDLDAGSLTVSYSYGSGDDDPNDDKHRTFDNLYPRNHPVYGHMDLFSLQNVHNIELAYLRPVSERLRLRAAVNGFWLDDANNDAWYNAGRAPVRRATSSADSYVGSELDLMLTFTLIPNQLSLNTGLSRFFGGDFLDDTGAGGDADFFYLQLSYSP